MCDETIKLVEIGIAALTAIGTIGAAWVACRALRTAKKAYIESQMMRKSSAFDALFSQLIGNHKDVFRAGCLQKTSAAKHDSTDYSWLKPNQDVFTNFYNYYMSQPKVDTARQLASRWADYKDLIRQFGIRKSKTA